METGQCLINNMCYDCWNQEQSPFHIPIQFNYECPQCGGKFNIPAYSQGTGTLITYCCPFCAYPMSGLNNAQY
jgi:hypothetical protein